MLPSIADQCKTGKSGVTWGCVGWWG